MEWWTDLVIDRWIDWLSYWLIVINWLIYEVCWIPLGLNSLHSPTTVVPNGVVINNASNPSANSVSEAHNGFIPGHSSGALDTKLTLSAPNNNSELSKEMAPSQRDQSAAYSQSFTVRAMLKESSAKPFASSSQPFTVDTLSREFTKKPSASDSQYDGKIIRHAHELCNSKGLPFSCA